MTIGNPLETALAGVKNPLGDQPGRVNLAINVNLNFLSASAAGVFDIAAPLEAGRYYSIEWELISGNVTNLFTPQNSGSPFGFNSLNRSIGAHTLTVEALDEDTGPIVRVSGSNVVFAYFRLFTV